MENDQQNRWLSEIRELNLSYLMLAQSMVRSDKPQALYSLGISEAVADILAELSPSQLVRIATSHQLLCRFRFDDELVWTLLSDHGRKATPGMEINASRLHASILMAGQFAEAV